MLLALSAIFVAYIVVRLPRASRLGRDGARARRADACRGTRHGILVVVATLGTTLAPWGLAFIQSYAVDKRLGVRDLGYERVDVVTGAVLTGVIGLFVVVACAATLHAQGIHVDDASDAARALEPLAGSAAHDAVRARARRAPRCWRRRSCRCRPPTRSRRRSSGRPTSTTACARRRVFYGAYAASMAIAAAIVLIPGAPLDPDPVPLAGAERVLLLAILPFIRSLARDRDADGRRRSAAGTGSRLPS